MAAAEAIVRLLRDGRLAGEHAPSLTITDSLNCPLGAAAFVHLASGLLRDIAAGRAQASGLVLVALERSPAYYFDLLRRCSGIESFESCFHILDCHTDPLGWINRISMQEPENCKKPFLPTRKYATIFPNIKEVDELLTSILNIGDGKGYITVAIDSVSHLLRHASLASISALISHIRVHDRLSSVFWSIHSDLHKSRVTNVFECLSTMIASLTPNLEVDTLESPGNASPIGQNYRSAKFQVRLKRRNGRLKLFHEEMYVEGNGVKFVETSSLITTVNQSLLPKVQFNLQLSDKERIDRSSVVLPFEHQGTGESIQIYDGRRSLQNKRESAPLAPESTAEAKGWKGEIHYIRDSDDERPDSDEDPDDDLDI